IESPVGDGIAIPIDKSCALLLTYAEKRRIATATEMGWTTSVRHAELGSKDAQDVRIAVAAYAHEAVYGPAPKLVESVSSSIGLAREPPPSVFATSDGCDLICHVYDYFRACSA